MIKRLGNNDTYKGISVDKHCGLVIIDTKDLTKRAVKDHIGDTTMHTRLPEKEAFAQLSGDGRLIELFTNKRCDELSVAGHASLK